MTLQEKLQEMMLSRGFKQNVLARRAGISQSLVSEILSGKRSHISLETMQKISTTLNVNTMYFIEKDRVRPEEFLIILLRKKNSLS